MDNDKLLVAIHQLGEHTAAIAHIIGGLKDAAEDMSPEHSAAVHEQANQLLAVNRGIVEQQAAIIRLIEADRS
jgi:hypothetical protein